jgi:hypothetical protein
MVLGVIGLAFMAAAVAAGSWPAFCLGLVLFGTGVALDTLE